MNVTEGVSRSLQTTTGMQPDHAWEVAKAALHSFWITGIGVLLGAVVASYADGVRNLAEALRWIADGHFYGFVVVQIITPIVRSRFTWQQLQKGPPPPTP